MTQPGIVFDALLATFQMASDLNRENEKGVAASCSPKRTWANQAMHLTRRHDSFLGLHSSPMQPGR